MPQYDTDSNGKYKNVEIINAILEMVQDSKLRKELEEIFNVKITSGTSNSNALKKNSSSVVVKTPKIQKFKKVVK